MKIATVGLVTIPLENIDYLKDGGYDGYYYVILKTGKKIECTKEEFKTLTKELEAL